MFVLPLTILGLLWGKREAERERRERSAESRFQKKCGKNMRHMLHGQAQASHCSKGVCVCVSKFTVTG